MTDTSALQNTFLVQRLHKPVKKTGSPLDNAHRVFGGGMMEISSKLWDMLDPVFTIDYMGAAEYEFGTVPKILQDMLKDAKILEGFSFSMERKDVVSNRERTWSKKPAKLPPAPTDPVTIYVLCRSTQKDGVTEVIRSIVAGRREVRDSTHIEDTLDPIRDFHGRTVGWLELNNGFFWFTDKTMWEGTLELFGTEPPSEEPK